MGAARHLTPDDLVARWAGRVCVGTLANWRWKKRGPKWVKLGKGRQSKVVYRLSDVQRYERQQLNRGK